MKWHDYIILTHSRQCRVCGYATGLTSTDNPLCPYVAPPKPTEPREPELPDAAMGDAEYYLLHGHRR